MSKKTDVNQIVCPHPDCHEVSKNLEPLTHPAGDYDCKCRAIKIRLSWAWSLEKGPYPYVEMVKDAKGTEK